MTTLAELEAWLDEHDLTLTVYLRKRGFRAVVMGQATYVGEGATLLGALCDAKRKHAGHA